MRGRRICAQGSAKIPCRRFCHLRPLGGTRALCNGCKHGRSGLPRANMDPDGDYLRVCL